MLTSASSPSSSLSACWLEEEDRVSYWQGLYGAWQGEPQPVQLCGLEREKVTEKKKEMQMVHSCWGDWSLNLLLQWMLTIIIFNPATDKWMDTAPQDCCQGSCDPVDCMPIEKRILSIFLSASERVGLPWTQQRRHTDVVPFALFFNGEGKYLFSNLDPSLSIVWINMLFVIKSLLVFLFTQYPKQMLTHLTML